MSSSTPGTTALVTCMHSVWRSTTQSTNSKSSVLTIHPYSHPSIPRTIPLPHPTPLITHLAYSRHHSRIYASTPHSGILVFAEDTAESLGIIRVGGGVLRGIVVDDERGCLYGVVGGVGGGVGVWSLDDGHWRGLMEGGGACWDVDEDEEDEEGKEVVMYVEGGYLYVGGGGRDSGACGKGGLWVWDLEEGVAVREMSVVGDGSEADGGKRAITAMVRVGECLWVGRFDGSICIYGIFGNVDEGVEVRGQVDVLDRYDEDTGKTGKVAAMVNLGNVVGVGIAGGVIGFVDVNSYEVEDVVKLNGDVCDIMELERRPYDRVALIAGGFHGDFIERVERFISLGENAGRKVLQVMPQSRNELMAALRTNGVADVSKDWSDVTKNIVHRDADPSVVKALQISLDRMVEILETSSSLFSISPEKHIHEKENQIGKENDSSSSLDRSANQLATEIRIAKQLLKLCNSEEGDNGKNFDVESGEGKEREQLCRRKYQDTLGIELEALQREKEMAVQEKNQVVEEMEILRKECDATVTSLERVLREVAAKAEEAEKKERSCRQTLARGCDELLGQAVDVGHEATRLKVVVKEAGETKEKLQALVKEKQNLESRLATLKGKMKLSERRAREKVETCLNKLKDSEKKANASKKEILALQNEMSILKETTRKIDQVVQERDRAKSEVEALNRKLTEAEQRSAAQLQESEEKSSSLREERDNLSRDIKSLSKENALMKDATLVLEKEVNACRESREKLQQALIMIEKSESEKDTALRLQRVKTRELEQDFGQCRTDLASAKRQRESISAELVSCMRQRDDERGEREKLESVVQNLRQVETSLKLKVSNLQEDLSKMVSSKTAIEKELIETKSSLRMSEQSSQLANEGRARALEDAEILRRERDALKLECTKLKSEVESGQASILGLMKDIESIKAGQMTEETTPSPAHDNASKRLSESLSNNRVQLDQLTVQLAELESEKDKAGASVSALNEEIRQLRECHEREKVDYEKSLLDTKLGCQQSEARLSALLDEIGNTKKERDEVARRFAELGSKVTSLSKQCHELEERSSLGQRELNAQTDALVALSKSAADADTERHHLQRQISRLEAENQRLTRELCRNSEKRDKFGSTYEGALLQEAPVNSKEAEIRLALESAKRETSATEERLNQLSAVARRYRAVAQTHRDSLPILIALDKELQRIASTSESTRPSILRASNVIADLVSSYYSEDDRKHSNATTERYLPSPFRRTAIRSTLEAWKTNREATKTTTSGARDAEPSSSTRPSIFAAWTPKKFLQF